MQEIGRRQIWFPVEWRLIEHNNVISTHVINQCRTKNVEICFVWIETAHTHAKNSQHCTIAAWYELAMTSSFIMSSKLRKWSINVSIRFNHVWINQFFILYWQMDKHVSETNNDVFVYTQPIARACYNIFYFLNHFWTTIQLILVHCNIFCGYDEWQHCSESSILINSFLQRQI